MASSRYRAALASVSALVLSGCHARSFPLATPPTYNFRTQASDGTLNAPVEGTLTDNGAGYAQGFRYTIPAPGALIITARPANASVQLDLDVFADGNVPIATTKDQPDKKLTVQDLPPGDVYIVAHESWKDAVATRFKLTAIYQPTDPDSANGPYKSQEGARDLSPDKGMVSDTVDYSAMRRTQYWKITLPGDGGLSLKFTKDDDSAHLSAEFLAPSGAPEKIDPDIGLKKDDLAAGDYYVKVTADDAGDAGKYTLATSFKGGDTCKNGGPACTADGAEDLKLPSDTRTAEVDFTKAMQTHFYKISIKEKGKLSLSFKVLAPARGSRIAAYFLHLPDEDGERITGSFLRPLDPDDYYIRVIAPEAGDAGKYALESNFQPDSFIDADVVEDGKHPCLLTVNAGTNRSVRAGAAVTIVGTNNVPIDTGVIDEAFPNLSTVRPLNSNTCSALPSTGARVEIAAQ